MIDHEVIVAGCGPAGLMACVTLKEMGIDVAGIDIKVRLDRNYRAASGFFYPEQDFNGDCVRIESDSSGTLLRWEKSGFSFLYPGTLLPVYRSSLVSNGGRFYTMTALKKPFMYSFDPTVWLKGLYERAVRAGVRFYPETMLLNAENTTGGVELEVRTSRNVTGKMNCRKLIASDGISSLTARKMGMNHDRPLQGRGPSAEYVIDNVSTPFPEGDIYIFGRDNLGMDAHVFMVPRPSAERGSYRMTTVVLGKAVKNRDVLEYMTCRGNLRNWFENSKIVSRHAAVMELYPAMKKPCKGNTIFLGDAAAMAESLYAGATMCGYMGAVAVGRELSGNTGFEQYTEWWNRSAFEMTNDAGKMAEYGKRMMFNAWMGPEVMDELFRLAEEHSFVVDEFTGNPYTYARTIIDHLQTVPGVRPGWKQKLEKLKTATLEDFIRVQTADLQ